MNIVETLPIFLNYFQTTALKIPYRCSSSCNPSEIYVIKIPVFTSGDFFYYNTSRFWNNALDATSNPTKYAATSNNEVVNVNSVNVGSIPPLINLLLS